MVLTYLIRSRTRLESDRAAAQEIPIAASPQAGASQRAGPSGAQNSNAATRGTTVTVAIAATLRDVDAMGRSCPIVTRATRLCPRIERPAGRHEKLSKGGAGDAPDRGVRSGFPAHLRGQLVGRFSRRQMLRGRATQREPARLSHQCRSRSVSGDLVLFAKRENEVVHGCTTKRAKPQFGCCRKREGSRPRPERGQEISLFGCSNRPDDGRHRPGKYNFETELIGKGVYRAPTSAFSSRAISPA